MLPKGCRAELPYLRIRLRASASKSQIPVSASLYRRHGPTPISAEVSLFLQFNGFSQWRPENG